MTEPGKEEQNAGGERRNASREMQAAEPDRTGGAGHRVRNPSVRQGNPVVKTHGLDSGSLSLPKGNIGEKKTVLSIVGKD
ncbi:hypothetical protein Y1Q_0001498 [Alligator mississippiensis]|uniref:Uncharacterized protein n=1 Tax=Alligator mississippiensis TaxID=8496 RepID=A0A151M9Q4_ALLMI|nr:hypothetical protein Y1Q_0001498 [Alligator mississippiensis]